HLLSRQWDAFQRDVIAAIVGQALWEVSLGHEEATRIIVADIERDQSAAVVVLCNVVDRGGPTESVHHPRRAVAALAMRWDWAGNEPAAVGEALRAPAAKRMGELACVVGHDELPSMRPGADPLQAI